MHVFNFYLFTFYQINTHGSFHTMLEAPVSSQFAPCEVWLSALGIQHAVSADNEPDTPQGWQSAVLLLYAPWMVTKERAREKLRLSQVFCPLLCLREPNSSPAAVGLQLWVNVSQMCTDCPFAVNYEDRAVRSISDLWCILSHSAYMCHWAVIWIATCKLVASIHTCVHFYGIWVYWIWKKVEKWLTQRQWAKTNIIKWIKRYKGGIAV